MRVGPRNAYWREAFFIVSAVEKQFYGQTLSQRLPENFSIMPNKKTTTKTKRFQALWKKINQEFTAFLDIQTRSNTGFKDCSRNVFRPLQIAREII